ncbi:MAG: hypothetical protein ABI379_11755 [Rhodanobacter sp.]
MTHQYIGTHAQLLLRDAEGQQVDEATAVVLIEEDGVPIAPALRDVQRSARNFDAPLTRHRRVECPDCPGIDALASCLYQHCSAGQIV